MGYPERFFLNLTKQFKNMDNSYPDLTLHSIEDGSKKKCHRIILSASSDYFTNLFTWDTSNILEVHNGITGETIDVILTYVYSNTIQLNRDNVNEVLIAANYFSIKEIVESCVDFILDNLEVKTCVSLLHFSWQIDIPKLLDGVSIYVANNFTAVLSDSILKEQLILLPIPLVFILLKSNNLIIRDERSKLPTRPAQREKCILDFILTYSAGLNAISDDDVKTLLSSIKWPILYIFDEINYVSEVFASRFDKGRRKDEISQHYYITHSEWFQKSSKASSSLLKETDKMIYATRGFTCSELVALEPLAGGNEIRGECEYFSVIAKPDEYIKQLDVITTSWEGKTVIGGMTVDFASSANGEEGCRHVGISAENGTSLYVIDLHQGEHIKSVFSNSGWFVDSLTFETTEGRCFGPYGGDGGEPKDLMRIITMYREEGVVYNYNQLSERKYNWGKSVAPGPHHRVTLDSILVGITGNKVMSRNEVIVRNLRFVFREMLPSSGFLMTKEKLYERSLSSSGMRGLVLRITSPDGEDDEDSEENDFEYMHNYGYYDLEHGFGGYWGMWN